MKEIYINSDYLHISDLEQKRIDNEQIFNIEAEIRKGKSMKEEQREE